jgi:nucleotide-binding universal stress UspA family protein
LTYSAILTHVQPDAEAAARLACAHDLAKRFGARLIGVGAEMIPQVSFDNGFYALQGEWMSSMRAAIDARLASAHTLFQQQTRDMAAEDAVWVSTVASPVAALVAASRAADLIVAGGAPRRGADPSYDASPAELAMRAGVPVLVVPSGGAAFLGRSVLVAWKDTREARRAVADALPFLESATAVEVVEICEAGGAGDSRIRTEDVAAALRRRGVAATAKVVVHHPATGEAIAREARAFGADLIVLGCYGHSRLGEWMSGGVTRDLLAQDAFYRLLSH